MRFARNDPADPYTTEEAAALYDESTEFEWNVTDYATRENLPPELWAQLAAHYRTTAAYADMVDMVRTGQVRL